MKYSKRIIENTIRHWLRILNETNMATLLNRLEEMFGRRNVYTSDRNVVINPENTRTIYNILNETCFDNILIMPEFEYSANPTDQAGLQIPQNVAGGYLVLLYSDAYYQMHIGGKAKIALKKFDSRPHLLFFTSVLCHEMIHQYNMEHGPELAYLTWCMANNQTPDMHPEFFVRMMNNISKQLRIGLSVNIKYDIEAYTKELVMFARIGDNKYRAVGSRKIPYDQLVETLYNKNMENDNKDLFNEATNLNIEKRLTPDMIDRDIEINGDKSFFRKISDKEYIVRFF